MDKEQILEAIVVGEFEENGHKLYDHSLSPEKLSAFLAEHYSKNPAAVALGSLGGLASAKALTKEERVSRAKKAVQAREAKRKPVENSPENPAT